MICKEQLRMFVKNSRIRFKMTTWRCVLNNKQTAAFVRIKKVRGKNCCGKKAGFIYISDGPDGLVLPNDALPYINNKSVEILFDPRK